MILWNTMVRNLAKIELQTELSREIQSVKVSWVPSLFSTLGKKYGGRSHSITYSYTDRNFTFYFKEQKHTEDSKYEHTYFTVR